jgi:hypothetical protein
MKNYILTAIVLLVLFISGCKTNAGTTNISVNETAAELRETTQETIHMNNCGGKADAKQTAEKSKSINIEFSGSLGVDKIVVNGEVSAKYSQVSGDVKKIEFVAPAKTNMEFVIEWTEKTWVGFVTKQGKDGQGKYKVSVPISVDLISSRDLGDCDTSVNTSKSQPSQIPTVVLNSNSALSESVNQQCQQFGGTPISSNNLTLGHVANWRVGQVDKPKVGRIIYCEIHQIPGYVDFVEGDTIPANTIITADLGFNWNSQYPQSLERLAHDGGGWGVFLTLKSIVVQHADDLNHSVGGRYWLISQ